MLSIATLLIAIAVKVYMGPCRIVTGSVSGLAILLCQLLKISDSLLVLLLNLLCLLVGVRYLGQKFGVRCIYVSVLLPALMAVIPDSGLLLSASKLVNIMAFLSFLTIGQVMMLNLDTTSGGLDTIAEVLARKLRVSTGLMIGILGAFVSLLTLGIYGLESALVGVLVTSANGAMINALNFVKNLKWNPKAAKLSA